MRLIDRFCYNFIPSLGILYSIVTFCAGDSVSNDEAVIYEDGLVGYDPRLSNIFVNPDPGRKKTIFKIENNDEFGRSSRTVHTAMRARKDPACDVKFTARVLNTFDEYVKEMHSRVSFENERDAIDLSKFLPDRSIWEFYEFSGKIIVVKASCITHSLSLDNLVDTGFSKEFNDAIWSIVGRRGPAYNVTEVGEKVKKLVRNFGTHYMKTSYLGASVVIRIMTLNTLRDEKLRDLESAAEEYFTSDQPSMHVITRVIRDLEGFVVNIITLGAPPSKSMKTWQLEAAQSPVAIQFELASLSSWFDQVKREAGPGYFDSHKFREELEKHDWLNPSYISHHPEKMATAIEQKASKLIPSPELPDSAYTNFQENELSVITGGRNENESSKSVLVLDQDKKIISTLPDLPEAVYGHTLTYLGDSVLLQLGGVGSTKALSINISAETPQWTEIEGLDFFNNKSDFTTVKLRSQSSPWIVLDSKMHLLKPSYAIESIPLPFTVKTGHCAVANDHHMYIIGAGVNRDEIWMNLIGEPNYDFVFLSYLPKGRQNHRCVWTGPEIYVVGGYHEKEGRLTPSRTCDVIDTLTGQVKKSKLELTNDRTDYGILIFRNQYTHLYVVGGVTKKRTKPIISNITETFQTRHESRFRMASSENSVNIERYSFGLVQFDL